MVPRSFLAIHATPSGDRPGLRAALGRVVEESRHLGIRPVETFYSLERGRAYTLVESDSAQRVLAAYEAAGVPVTDVVEAERFYPDLLDRPRRSR